MSVTARALAGRRLVALAALAHVLIVSSVATGVMDRWWNDARNRPGPGADFFAVYHAGRQVLAGRSPYTMEERPAVTPAYFAPFRYAPGVAFTVGVAVARIRPWIAYGLWIAVIEGMVIAAVWGVGRLVREARVREWAQAGVLAFPPMFLEVRMGQFTWVTTVLVLLAVVAWSQRQSGRAAAAWAAACALKLFPLAMVPGLVRARKWSALVVAAIVCGVAMAWLVGRGEDARGWLRLNFGPPEMAEIHAGNFGVQAFLYRGVAWVHGAPGHEAWASAWRVVAGTFVLGAGVTMVWARRGDDVRLVGALALWMLPVVAKDAWEHYYVVVPVATAMVVAAGGVRAWERRALVGVWIVCALPSLLVVLQREASTWDPEAAWGMGTRVVYHAPRAIAAIVGFGVTVGVAWGGGEASTSPSPSTATSTST